MAMVAVVGVAAVVAAVVVASVAVEVDLLLPTPRRLHPTVVGNAILMPTAVTELVFRCHPGNFPSLCSSLIFS